MVGTRNSVSSRGVLAELAEAAAASSRKSISIVTERASVSTTLDGLAGGGLSGSHCSRRRRAAKYMSDEIAL